MLSITGVLYFYCPATKYTDNLIEFDNYLKYKKIESGTYLEYKFTKGIIFDHSYKMINDTTNNITSQPINMIPVSDAYPWHPDFYSIINFENSWKNLYTDTILDSTSIFIKKTMVRASSFYDLNGRQFIGYIKNGEYFIFAIIFRQEEGTDYWYYFDFDYIHLLPSFALVYSIDKNSLVIISPSF